MISCTTTRNYGGSRHTGRRRGSRERGNFPCCVPQSASGGDAGWDRTAAHNGRRADMNREQLRALLDEVAAGRTDAAAAFERMSWSPVEAVGPDAYARLDHHRLLRNGMPEVVFGEGKTTGQIVEICGRLAERGGFLATRLETATQQAIRNA